MSRVTCRRVFSLLSCDQRRGDIKLLSCESEELNPPRDCNVRQYPWETSIAYIVSCRPRSLARSADNNTSSTTTRKNGVWRKWSCEIGTVFIDSAAVFRMIWQIGVWSSYGKRFNGKSACRFGRRRRIQKFWLSPLQEDEPSRITKFLLQTVKFSHFYF